LINKLSKKIILDWDLHLDYRILHINIVLNKEKFTCIGQGRHRRVYIDKNGKYVLKFPLEESGLEANKNEHSLYRNRKNYKWNLAPCRLIDDYLILMKAVKVTFGYSGGDYSFLFNKNKYITCDPFGREITFPNWSNGVDCRQVGLFKPDDKDFVVYDYG
jgi:hypothetical protein